MNGPISSPFRRSGRAPRVACAAAAVAAATVLPLAESARAQVFPGAAWESRSPAELGLDPAKLAELQSLVGGSGMIVRGGYVAYAWGDVSTTAGRNWASASKPALSTLLFMADHRGLCSIGNTMGEYLQGGSVADRSITFHALANMISGYSRGENPGQAWAYNDYAINLYGYVLFHEVFGGEPSVVFPQEFAFLGFQDAPTVSDTQYGRIVAMSIRDFARLGLFWLNEGAWDGVQHVAPYHFQFVTNQVPPALPVSTQDGAESWDFGTFGGGDNQEIMGPGEYGYNFWVNTNGFWPGVPADVFQANGHGGDEVCTVFPSLGIVAVGVGVWGHPSTAPLQKIVEAASGAPVGVDGGVTTDSWGAIKQRYSR